MPIYDFHCEKCKKTIEVVQIVKGYVPQCCGQPMIQKIGMPAMIRIKGQGYPSRRKWMDNWTPGSPPFPTSSVHGEKK